MPQSLLKNNILRAYGSSLLGIASGLLTNLWLLREITKVVSVHDFGIYAFVLQISGYLAMLQLGLDFAASRQIAESLGRNDSQEASRAFSDLVRFNYKIVALAFAVVLGVSALLFSGVTFKHAIDSGFTSLAGTIAFVAGVSQIITFLTRPFAAALIGSQFQATVNIWAVARTICTTLLAFGFLRAGYHVLSVPAAEVVTQLAYFFVLRAIANKRCTWKTAAPAASGHNKLFGSMLRYGGLTSLGGFAWTIEAGMDVVLLGLYSNAAVVAAYVLWWRFPQMLFDVCSRLAFSAFPRFSHSFGTSTLSARTVFTKVAYLTLGLATLALVGISYWLRPFVHLWIGADYLAEQSIYLAMSMGLLVCLRACGNLLGMFWLASGRAGLTTTLAWAQAALKLLLVVLLVPRWSILGVIIASCGASLLQIIVMAWFLMRERLLTSAVAGRALAFTVLASVLSLLGSRWSIDVGWTGFIGGAAATCAIWTVTWALLVYTGELRKPLMDLLLQVARRARLVKAT
jgi:O-antigen/teichoic acid export membrane protein